ncbi:MAG: hypothetical protein VR65_15550 [Desulfobulbaceae bacterium BRH_c16a]|nr:MAG: hypothetical protein VR65_15550 [Desulfobulbaceae bacterium BRH_c16a]
MPDPALAHSERKNVAPLWEVPGGNPQQGPASILRHGCFSCHMITGVRRAKGRVGPKLYDIREQMYIGGVLANSPDNMIRWIRNPRRFSPETAMPELDVSDRDARDITAYLFR